MSDPAPQAQRFDEFSFDPADGRLEHEPSGRALALRPQAARLLLALLHARGGVVDRDTLYAAVWDPGTVVDFEAGLAALMRELRQSLDQLAGKAGLLETIPRRGYRLKAAESPPVSPAPAPSQRQARRPQALALIGLLIAALAIAWLAWPRSTPVDEGGMDAGTGAAGSAAGAPLGRTLAVLPFQLYQASAGDKRLELLLADALLAALWQAELDGLQLIGRATLLPYADRDDVAGAVARDLGVDLLIEGNAIEEAGAWQVTARLLHMPAGRVLWSETVEVPASQPMPVRETVERLVRSLAEAWPMLGE
jgi:DNA-binding winged helix-turn-helix (wHTH) protein/TolB-like protein